MPRNRLHPQLVIDDRTGLPPADLRGVQATLMLVGTNTPATLTLDEAGTVPADNPVQLTEVGTTPQVYLDEGVHDVDVVSGENRITISSIDGLRREAADAQAAAAVSEAEAIAARSAADAARADADAALARKGFVVVDNVGDPLPAGWRPNDLAVYRNATGTGGGGGTVTPDPWLLSLDLDGLADGHLLSAGTGPAGTPLDEVSTPSLAIQVVATLPLVHVPANTTSYTARWTGRALGVFAFDLPIAVRAAPTKNLTLFQITGVLGVSMNTGRQLTILNSAGGAATSSVGGSIGGASPALALGDGLYHLKGTRADTATGTLTRFRLYDPAGAQVWSTDGVNRDVGVATGTAAIFGRFDGTAGGEFLFGEVRVDDVPTEI